MTPGIDTLKEKKDAKTLGLEGKEETDVHITQTDVISQVKEMLSGLSLMPESNWARWLWTVKNISGLGLPLTLQLAHHGSLSCLPSLWTIPQPCPASHPSTAGHSPRECQLNWT